MFSKWMKVVNNNELLKTVIDMQENFVDDYLKFEDYSVGIIGIYSIDERVVDDINSNVEEVEVLEWNKNMLLLEVSEKYVIKIEMVSLGMCEDGEEFDWGITNAFEIRK
jgi:hypothetical protein